MPPSLVGALQLLGLLGAGEGVELPVLLLHLLHFCQGTGVGHSLGAAWHNSGMGEMCGGSQC